uniref:HECT domain-containing protein n=2 Tax=Euplotes crassus TaxID=5936 RepID=A0A7S3NSU1_EUPCR|mmetsp:Transcript_13440/g.13363  ORF Transcript_13440/g.13363 Transcript_13440/m.13363 type:complete len:788 (+) Transcript_13440:352-2715(+)
MKRRKNRCLLKSPIKKLQNQSKAILRLFLTLQAPLSSQRNGISSVKLKRCFMAKSRFQKLNLKLKERISKKTLSELHWRIWRRKPSHQSQWRKRNNNPKKMMRKKKIETTKQSNIDLPVELERIQESDDVVFEFYYNRMKIPNTKTVYELINYQPTHRQIVDQYIIYYRILDRSEIIDDLTTQDQDFVDNNDEEGMEMLGKEKQLLNIIKSNTSGFSPVLREFMEKYISPYLRPDSKPKVTGNQNYNPYSYVPAVQNKQPTKIGISATEQRLISKKSRKICEALVYILDQWKEIKTYSDFIDKDLNVPKPQEIFKNLLDEYVQKILMEPLNLILDTKKHKLLELFDTFMKNPYLLGFETRALFFKIAAFAHYGEFHRSIHFLVQYLRKKHSNIPDSALHKHSKEKVKIDRKTLLKSAVNLLTTPGRVKKKNFLEIQFCNEEGTGLGPTLEFYYLCSKEFRHLSSLWREMEDNSLFPAPFSIAGAAYGEEEVLKYFEALGALISRAIADDKLTDLPLSSLFWDICIGKPIKFDQILKINSAFGKSVNELRDYSLKRQKILKNTELEDQIKERQLANCKMRDDVAVEDLCLYFNIPGTDIDLKEGGSDILVTNDNLEEYLDLLLHQMLDTTISKQVNAFKKGFGRDMKYLRLLRSDELELIVCGNNDDEKEWTIQNMKEHIIPSHGYHDTSKTYLYFLDYMSKLSPHMRRQVLTFTTGSPRLPLGGFKNLKPKMSVVRKSEGDMNPDGYLPSVMTCQNFLKVPEYSSLDILTEKFNTASSEGQESFTLS